MFILKVSIHNTLIIVYELYNLIIFFTDRPFECEECGKRFFACSAVKEHINAVHKKVKPFECTVPGCDYRAVNKGRLNFHIKVVHTAIRSYKCEKCDKTFTTSYYLKIHTTRVHDNVRNHKCDQCDKAFKSITELKTHVKIVHEGIKKFQCELCSYAGGKGHNLKSHMKLIHGKEIRNDSKTIVT